MRKNVVVVTNTTVTRIIFEEIEGEVHATGVEFAKDRNGKKYRAKAKRDIVLRLVSHDLDWNIYYITFAKCWICSFASCEYIDSPL